MTSGANLSGRVAGSAIAHMTLGGLIIGVAGLAAAIILIWLYHKVGDHGPEA